MFFRDKTSSKSTKSVLQLVENKRDGNRIRQRVIVSLGTDFGLPGSLRGPVATAVEQRLTGQAVLFEEHGVSEWADRIVKKIHTASLWRDRSASSAGDRSDRPIPDVVEVVVDEVAHGHARSLGPLLIGHHFWQQLGLPALLSDCGFNRIQSQTAAISVLNRLIDPGSEHSLLTWIPTVAVADLISPHAEEFAADRFYRISDKLLSHQAPIEAALYGRAQTLFELTDSIFLYDLTNTYFEGQALANPKAKYNGNQKEKRTDCPQVVVALGVDGDGFIRRHWTFAGTMSDSASLPSILDQLAADSPEATRPTIIMDRGVATDDNLALLKSKGFHYIVVSRSGDERAFLTEFQTAVFKTIETASGAEVEIHQERRDQESYLLCRSGGRKSKETAMRNRAEAKLEADLAGLHRLLETGQRKDPSVIEQSIGRIRERHSRAAYYYDITFSPFEFDYEIAAGTAISKRLTRSLQTLKDKVAVHRISHPQLTQKLTELAAKYESEWSAVTVQVSAPSLSWQPFDEKRSALTILDGCYLLRTDRLDLDDEQTWRLYMTLTRLEAAFRHLKSDLGLQPNFHQREDRVDGHIFISILAYHLLHAIETTLRRNDDHHCWATIQRVMSNHHYSTIMLPTPEGDVIHVRKPGQAEPIHEEIYSLLGVDYTKLPVIKTRFKNKKYPELV